MMRGYAQQAGFPVPAVAGWVAGLWQRTAQRQPFYRNFVILGAPIVFFGTFVTLGSELRFSITGPLFHF